MGQDRMFVWKTHREWLGWPENGAGGVSGNPLRRADGVSKVDGDSRVGHVCTPGVVGGGLEIETVASAGTSVGEEAAPPALGLKPDGSAPARVSCCPESCSPRMELGESRHQVSPRAGRLRGPLGLQPPPSPSAMISAGFQGKFCVDFSSWHRNLGWGAQRGAGTPRSPRGTDLHC